MEFLKELLASLTRIELQGYQRLQDLGASPLIQVFSAGGGASNAVWEKGGNKH
ncbi:MAG: hypothetical protein HC810_05295 [Acaryochloridaceae cyanobacterium RL_2_7]|nr:hypothetical protein [Acaryochloridaceae cyanobacterium RL_2_7]